MKLICTACKGDLSEPAVRSRHRFAGGDIDTLFFCNRLNEDASVEFDEVTEDPRPDRRKLFLDAAALFAQRSTCPRRHVGCVIVKDRRIISVGYNGAPPGAAHCTEVGCLPGPDGGCLRTTHAEMNAIVWAARSGVALEGSEVYSTDEPCLACAKAIATAGVRQVYYSEPYRLHDGIELLSQLDIRVYQYQTRGTK